MSADKINEMVLRGETGEFFHYPTFLEADKFYKNEDLCFISDFTKNYLHGIDYENVLEKRRTNLKILHDILKEYNKLKLEVSDLTYLYPLLSDDGVLLRKYLKENNVYSPMLWPNMHGNGASSKEIEMANNVILLPIDQRYGLKEMTYISEVVEKFYQKTKIKK